MTTGIHPSATVEAEAIGAGATIGEFAVVRSGVVIGAKAVIHPHVVIEAHVEIGEATEVLPGSYIGRTPKAVGAVVHEPVFSERLTIGAGGSIGPNAVIYYDTAIGAEVLVGDGASIREGCRIGSATVIGRLATVDRDVIIGDRTFVMDKAFLAGAMRVGADVFIAAGVISANDNTFGKGGPGEIQAPTVEDKALIGGGASLLPGVVIGRAAIVGSGAVVTRDVEPETVVLGVPARPVTRDR